jgi:hypothetical protein
MPLALPGTGAKADLTVKITNATCTASQHRLYLLQRCGLQRSKQLPSAVFSPPPSCRCLGACGTPCTMTTTSTDCHAVTVTAFGTPDPNRVVETTIMHCMHCKQSYQLGLSQNPPPTCSSGLYIDNTQCQTSQIIADISCCRPWSVVTMHPTGS